MPPVWLEELRARWDAARRRSRSRSRSRSLHATAVGRPHLDAQPDPPLPSDPTPYTLGPVLGRGATSVVHAATCSTHPHLPLAVKIIDLERAGDNLDLVIREVRLAASVKSPHLAPLWAAFSGGGSELWLVQPRAVCSVRDVLDRHCGGGRGLADAAAAAAVVKAVAGGLAALHALGVAHRDVKASNVLLFACPDGRLSPRLADLGTAGGGAGLVASTNGAGATKGRALSLGPSLWRRASSLGRRRGGDSGGSDNAHTTAAAPVDGAVPAAQSPHGIASPFAGNGGSRATNGKERQASSDLPSYTTFAGSPAWMAPEVFGAAAGGADAASSSTSSSYSTPADLYSLACLICELGHGAPPGATAPFPVLAMSRLHGPPPELHRPPGWPAEAAALVATCGAREAEKRPSAAAVMGSPWLRGEGVEADGGRALAALVAAAAAADASTKGARLAALSRSEVILAPFRARVAPPPRIHLHHHHHHGEPGVACGSPHDPAGDAAAALLDPTAAGRILRSALLPRCLAAQPGPLRSLLAAAALPSGSVPESLASLGAATAVAVFGRDHCAGRALGRFHYRLGAAFLRVPVPPAGHGGPDAAADAAYEADAHHATAWAGPIMFFLGRRRPALPGAEAVKACGQPPSGGDPAGDESVVLSLTRARGARILSALLASTASGGRRLSEVMTAGSTPNPDGVAPHAARAAAARSSGGPQPPAATGVGGAGPPLWMRPAPPGGDPSAWPAPEPWANVSAKVFASTWLHVAADLTAAAHRAGSGRRAGRRGGEDGPPGVTVGDVLSGKLAPPHAWREFVGDLVAAREYLAGRRE